MTAGARAEPERLAQVAASLDATPELLPYLPELLADCQALGSSPEVVVELLAPLGLGAQARVLDVGCGKGAVAVAVAAALPCRVDGIDAFAPFVDEARRRAAAAGVAERCRFTCGDMRALGDGGGDQAYDVVVFAAHGPLLGGAPATEALRGLVRVGGWIVVADGHLAPDVADPPAGYEDYLPRDATIARMTRAGFALVREIVERADAHDARNRAVTEGIRRRAAQIAARHPQAAPLLAAYVARQERECDALARAHVPASWLLRRE